MNHSKCPRCGSLAYEHLRTHSYCWECGYSPDQDAALKRPLNSGHLGVAMKNRQQAVAVNSGGRGAALNSDRMKAVKTSKFFVPREPSAVKSNADRPGPKDRLH